VRGGNGIRSRFLLFVDDRQHDSTRAAALQLCESSRDIVEFRSSPNSGVTLIRPDGYIAFAAHDSTGTDAISSVRSVLQRQTGRLAPAAGREMGVSGHAD
jgi:hypothetical protein